MEREAGNRSNTHAANPGRVFWITRQEAILFVFEEVSPGKRISQEAQHKNLMSLHVSLV